MTCRENAPSSSIVCRDADKKPKTLFFSSLPPKAQPGSNRKGTLLRNEIKPYLFAWNLLVREMD